jgi:hypothetical protein
LGNKKDSRALIETLSVTRARFVLAHSGNGEVCGSCITLISGVPVTSPVYVTNAVAVNQLTGNGPSIRPVFGAMFAITLWSNPWSQADWSFTVTVSASEDAPFVI